MNNLMPEEELERAMRNVFGIDGKGLKWKAQQLHELLGECPESVREMCNKLGEYSKNRLTTKETKNEQGNGIR